MESNESTYHELASYSSDHDETTETEIIEASRIQMSMVNVGSAVHSSVACVGFI